MSEVPHDPNSEMLFIQDRLSSITLNYPFCDTVLQYTALQELGYPVRLRSATKKELLEQHQRYNGDESLAWAWQTQANCLMAEVIDPEFKDWVGCPDYAWSLQPRDSDWDRLLESHPVYVVSLVDAAEFKDLAYRLEQLAKSAYTDDVHDADVDPQLAELLERCFMAAFERNMENEEADEESYQNGYHGFIRPKGKFITLYDGLAAQGQTAITQDELKELFKSFYILFEQIDPAFKSFKKS